MARFLIVSDLHAFIGSLSDRSPSQMALGTPTSEGLVLLEDCLQVVRDRFGSVDAVLVAGDLSDRASGDALRALWPELGKLAEGLQAKLYATAGNHDYDSRDNGSGNPKGDLLDLEPPFPFHSEAARLNYFAYDFAVDSQSDYVIVSINSAAQHGYRKGNVPEHVHGRITASTIKRLGLHIQAKVLPDIKIALIHHHVSQLPGLDHAEQSVVQDAQELHHRLESSGQWIIIHGHKHRPYVQRVSGNGDAPIAISAGSFSANLGGTTFAGQVQNQFHVIEVRSHPVEAPELTIAGTVYSWSFTGLAGSSWRVAGSSDALPGESGFGWKGSPASLAAAVADMLSDQKPSLSRAEVESVDPSMVFMTSRELQIMDDHLKSTHDANIIYDLQGRVQNIERRVA
nr:metallophosphoesterase [Frigoribacterium sp. Leaf8]